jgi:hypothetical protein
MKRIQQPVDHRENALLNIVPAMAMPQQANRMDRGSETSTQTVTSAKAITRTNKTGFIVDTKLCGSGTYLG